MRTQQLEEEKPYAYSATLRGGIWQESTWQERCEVREIKPSEPRDQGLPEVDAMIDYLLRDAGN
jgi:hypothetical protein